MAAPPTQLRSLKVAVIGGGASGLVSARELSREGHRVVVFESRAQLGGTWLYSPDVESDPIGQDPGRSAVYSSLYSSLRTNIPREVMGFRDFPFVVTERAGRDSRRFPGHEEVLRYLEDFASEFKLNELIQYQSEVIYVGLENSGKWKARSSRKRQSQSSDLLEDEEIFDAVVVCNGHYNEPQIAEIIGIELWPGRQIHSHNYRVPEPYRNLIVIVIGGNASAEDISREIASVAKEVHIGASRSAPKQIGAVKLAGYENLWLHSMIGSANADGSIIFEDGSSVFADVIIHCTGYKYTFPFLETDGALIVEDNCVGPLYKHVFPPTLAPGLSFVGVPSRAIPLPISEIQSRWIAGVLSGRVAIPSEERMMQDVEAFYKRLESDGLPKRFTHFLGEHMFEYFDWIAGECGCLSLEEWKKQMFWALLEDKQTRPETYRDEWDDEHFMLQAHGDFADYLKFDASSGEKA